MVFQRDISATVRHELVSGADLLFTTRPGTILGTVFDLFRINVIGAL
jgi:hypothetical protein